MTSQGRRFGLHWRPLTRVWPLVMTAIAVALAGLGGEEVRLALRYDKAAIGIGEWWRLATGHLVHLGWQHTGLNLAGLVLVIALFYREYRSWHWVTLLLASGGAISAGFLLLRPDLSWYVGLSGVLHAFFVAGAVRWIARNEWEGWLLAAFLGAKLVWEQFFGALPLSVSTSGGPVVVDAHLYGALSGLLVALILLRDPRSPAR